VKSSITTALRVTLRVTSAGMPFAAQHRPPLTELTVSGR